MNVANYYGFDERFKCNWNRFLLSTLSPSADQSILNVYSIPYLQSGYINILYK